MNNEWKPTIESYTKRLKGLMQSCYAYDGLSKDNSYIAKYEDKLGTELFNKVYDEHKTYLEDMFTILRGVGSDSEGNVYNSLQEK